MAWTVDQLAEAAGVSTQAIRAALQEGRIRGQRAQTSGRVIWTIDDPDADAYLIKRTGNQAYKAHLGNPDATPPTTALNRGQAAVLVGHLRIIHAAERDTITADEKTLNTRRASLAALERIITELTTLTGGGATAAPAGE